MSILDQKTAYKFEIIVSDDCSTDNTLKIINEISSEYPGKISIISQVKNLGPFQNTLSVIELAKSKYIAHCDGDDYWLQGKLQKQLDILETNLEVCAVFTNAIKGKDLTGVSSDSKVMAEAVLSTIFTFNPFIRSSLIERNNGLNNLKKYIISNNIMYDFEYYWVQLKGIIYIIGEPYVEYNCHEAGISKAKNILLEYKKAITRLQAAGLRVKIIKAMLIDYELANYFRSNDPKIKINLINYLLFGRIKINNLIKIILPPSIILKLKLFFIAKKN